MNTNITINLTKTRRSGDPVTLIAYDPAEDQFLTEDHMTFKRRPEWDGKDTKAYAIPDSTKYRAIQMGAEDMMVVEETVDDQPQIVNGSRPMGDQPTEDDTTYTLERANKLTVKTLDDGVMQADFYRTHKHIATIRSTETGFVPNEDAETKTAIREDFRKFIADHAADIGVHYDPTDRRTESNVRKSTYKSAEDVMEDAIAMVSSDIDTFISKMPNAGLVKGYEIGIESLTPKTHTSKGSSLAMMGIEDGKYVSNGNLAWFDIDGVVTIQIKADNTETEIYQPIKMELVSGQLKKFRMTQTQWNTETTNSLTEAGIIKNKEGEEG